MLIKGFKEHENRGCLQGMTVLEMTWLQKLIISFLAWGWFRLVSFQMVSFCYFSSSPWQLCMFSYFFVTEPKDSKLRTNTMTPWLNWVWFFQSPLFIIVRSMQFLSLSVKFPATCCSSLSPIYLNSFKLGKDLHMHLNALADQRHKVKEVFVSDTLIIVRIKRGK